MFSPFGVLCFGQLLAENDNSVENPLYILLRGETPQLQFLIELYPWNSLKDVEFNFLPAPFGALSFGAIQAGVASGAVDTIYLSDMTFITTPEDDPANQYFAPVVNNPLQFDLSVLRGETLGTNTTSFGAIQIQNGDKELDHLASMNWGGRRIVVKAGGKDFAYTDYSVIFDGLCNTIEFDDRTITITVQDKGLRLEQPIISPKFAGTGGLEGGDDIANRMRPLIYGRVFNFEPVLVDPVNLVYSVHAWSIEEISAVFDAGVALTLDDDYTDITTASPAAGHYATSLASGYIKLGSTPAGRITLNAKGDNVDGYSGTVSGICYKILTNLFGNESYHPTELDLGSFNALSDQLPQEVGLVVTDQRTMRSIIDDLLTPYLAYWVFTRPGLFSPRYIDTEGVPVATITPDFVSEDGIQMLTVVEPAWRISVGYAPVSTVQKEDEIAGGATEAQRSFVGNEFRFISYEDIAVKRTNTRAQERIFYTSFATKEAAEELLARLLRVYGRERKIYRGVGYNSLYRFYLGDKVKLDYPRYNLNKEVVVLGISEDAETKATTLDLWG